MTLSTIKLPVRIVPYTGKELLYVDILNDADGKRLFLPTIAAALNGQEDVCLDTSYDKQNIRNLVATVRNQSAQLSAMRKALIAARKAINQHYLTTVEEEALAAQIDAALSSSSTEPGGER